MTLRALLARSVLPALALPLWCTAAAQIATPPADSESVARSAVHDCVDRINGTASGLAAIEARCPGLAAALQAAGIRPLLIETSRSRFDHRSLRELPNLIHPATGLAPSVVALEPVLRGLRATPAAELSWWQRLLDWLSEHLATKQRTESSYPWLTGILKWLARPQWLWTAVIWGTVIALPVAVVIIVVREMRALGQRSIDDPLPVGVTAEAVRFQSGLAQLRQLPPGQRPAKLFAMLIARLVAAGRLPPDRSLTHREVVKRVVLDDADQRLLIESLARLAERQLYSAGATTPAGLDDVLARGEDLYTIGWGPRVET
jgi:hypothetical protein